MKSERRLPSRSRREPHRVVMLTYPDTQVLDVTGPLEVFARTSRWLRDHNQSSSAYAIELVAAEPGPLRTSGGLRLLVDRPCSAVRTADTLLISGGIGYHEASKDASLLAWISRMSRRVERLGSICTGAILLAAAGLLDGQRATTHWAYCGRLSACAPRTRVEPDALYVRSGNIYTSAGVTAGMDMALAMVEEDWGKATALAVAQELVMYLKRPGGQSQFSRHLRAQQRDDRLGPLEVWMLDHLDEDLSVKALARRANLSPRHFAREFRRSFGLAPGAYVKRLRVEAARRRIEEGATPLKRLARECGFVDEQNLRRGFRDVLGITPRDYRARF